MQGSTFKRVVQLTQKNMESIRPTYQRLKKAPNQLVYNLPERIGRGIVKVDRFSTGLWLAYMDLDPIKPITFCSEIPEWGSGMSFILTGHSEIRLSEQQQVISSKAETNAHFFYPNPQNMEEDIVARRLKVSLMFDKKALLDFANEDEEPFLPFLKGLEKQVPVYDQGKIAPEIQRSLHQIIDCPYSGKTRSIFLEGKAMEIFAHKLEALRAEGCKGLRRKPRISASDIERLHYAAELLVCDSLNPPDLTDLAGQVGMSRSKFYNHFKVVFGHTPMEYLRCHRLRAAERLIRQGSHNVTEAAFAVGYNNLSNFTKIFVAEFGIHPCKLT